MGLKDKLKRITRMAEREMVAFKLEDGTTTRFYEGEIFPECFLHETGRWRRNYFGEDPGPAHPFVEALRKSKEREPERLAQTQGTITLPPEVDLLLALHHQRSHARRDGKPVPPFSEAQVEEMHRQDLELTGPTMEEWRTTPGWTSGESQRLLDEWEEGALARLRDVDKGASKSEVYESVDEDETEDEDD